MPSMLSKWSLTVVRSGCWVGPSATCSPSLSSTTRVRVATFLHECHYSKMSGISVTKEMSATTRSILDQIRVILIWAVFLIPWGGYLCRVQDYFVWTAVRKQINKYSYNLWENALSILNSFSIKQNLIILPGPWTGDPDRRSVGLQWHHHHAHGQEVHHQASTLWRTKPGRRGTKVAFTLYRRVQNCYG